MRAMIKKKMCMGFLAITLLAAGVFSPAPARAKPPLLNDIPDEVADYIIKRYLLLTLADAQGRLISAFLKDKEARLSNWEKSRMLEFRKYSLASLSEQNWKKGAAFTNPVELGGRNIVLFDTRRLAREVEELKRKISGNIRDRFQLAKQNGPPALDFEEHNFYVFYIRDVHRLCGPPVEWAPSGMYDSIQFFYSMFSKDGYLRDLHAHLEDPRNDPFMSSRNFFLIMYFQYLRLAYESGYIKLGLRQLLVGREKELKSRFPEMVYLRLTLAKMRDMYIID